MKELRSLALQSLPDSPGIRSTVWKVGITRIMILVCFHLYCGNATMHITETETLISSKTLIGH